MTQIHLYLEGHSEKFKLRFYTHQITSSWTKILFCFYKSNWPIYQLYYDLYTLSSHAEFQGGISTLNVMPVRVEESTSLKLDIELTLHEALLVFQSLYW